MAIIIDPITKQRILVQPNSGDITYDLEGDSAITKEDVPLNGPWEDWTGSDTNPLTASSRTQQMFASSENQLWGTEPHITEGTKIPNLSEVGTRKGTHRRRIIKRYAKIGKDGAINFE